MAEEDQQHPDHPDDSPSDAPGEPDVAEDSDQPAPDTGSGKGEQPETDEAGEPAEEPFRTTFVANPENQLKVGYLTLHYPTRDVRIPVDGDAALRVMAAHQRRRQQGLGDILNPTFSSAASGWLTLDPEEPMAISWLPGLGQQRRRMAIDPAI